jgi:protein-glutamine gamma-glutamyltransferase
MSANAPALAPALAPAVGPRGAQTGAGGAGAGTARPLVRLVAFAGLALFGALRWGALMTPAPTGRLVGLVAIAAVLVVAGPWTAQRSRAAAILLAVLAALAMLLVCGLPWSWLRHVRIAVSARAIGTGLDALPRLLVPYHGVNPRVRMVLSLGAALLIFDAALMLAFAARPPSTRRAASARSSEPEAGDLRRAIASLPLIALAAVPLTLVPARFQYVEGAVMFGLLAALVWGERLPRRGAGTVAFICGLACAAAMVAAPWLDARTPWIHYQTLGSGIGLEAQENFDWSQRYGPLNWPRDGRLVLEVAAPRADYWKAVNLEMFDGRQWAQAQTGLDPGAEGVSAAARASWTESVSITVAAMTTSNVIGPGELEPPTHIGVNTSSNGLGRFSTYAPMGPGDSYQVRAYSPHPSAKQLAAAGTAYPQSIVPLYLQLTLPGNRNDAGAPPTVWSDAFGSPAPVLYESTYGGEQGAQLLDASPYARAFALARRLRAKATTPYAYAMSVMSLLAHGYTYDEHPPARAYPLESFLFTDRRGYCQQFAGAMALLLRLGGVPARVGAGFTAGQFDPSSHRWLVSDYDAHAWVEAFFPRYGWVRFDPTPAGSDPAQQKSHLGSLLPAGGTPAPLVKPAVGRHGLSVPGSAAAARRARARRGAGMALLPILAVLALAVLAGAAFVTRPVRDPTPAQLVAELERAFHRTGRELPAHLTLAELQRRMVNDPGALAYLQAISRARFGGPGPLPTPAQRRALRGALAAGLGVSGHLRALWALPPRW